MSPADQVCAVILVVALFAALAGAAVMIGGVYEGHGATAWVGGLVFFGFALAAAWCFGGLV